MGSRPVRAPFWARVFLALYPPSFRRSYREELDRMVGASAPNLGPADRLRLLSDLLAGALLEWLEILFRTESPLEVLVTMLERIARETRQALRRLLRSPGFAVVTILTVALGVGANTAVFTLVNGVLLRPLPYEEPEELGFVWSGLDWIGVPRAWISGPQIPFLREHADRFEDFAALRLIQADLTAEEGVPGQRVGVGTVTGNLFDLLGVEAALGRTLTPAEEGPGAPLVAVLTHAAWRDALGADPGVVGREIRLEGTPYQIVGVLPENFRFAVHSSLGDPGLPDLYVPLDHDLPTRPRGNFSYALLGRTADGASWPEAVAEMEALGGRYGSDTFRRDDFVFRVAALHPDLVRQVRPALLMLMGAVALVLLIACSNVATLFLGRALHQQREVAVRGALGAGRWSRLGPALLESGIVAAAGGSIGVLVAYAATGFLLALAPSNVPRAATIEPDWRVLTFSLLATAVVAMAIAITPAWRQRRVDLTSALRDGGRGGSRRSGAQQTLVVVQVTLSALLLVGAGLMGRSLLRLADIDPGFATAGVAVASVRIPGYLYEDDIEARGIFDQVGARALAHPEIEAAGWTGSVPLSGNTNQNSFGVDRSPEATGDPEEDNVLTDQIAASPGYFDAAGIELIAGRDFATTDTADTEPVVVVDRSLADRFWPDGAVGGELTLPSGETTARIVGVVDHARLYDIRADDRYQVYQPVAQAGGRELALVARAAGDVGAAQRAMADIVRSVDPRLATSGDRTIADVVGDALASWRFLLQLLGAFALAALTLATLGVYGVVSLSVAARTRSIGIRMALGARAAEIGRDVLGQGLRLVAIGLVTALAGAWVLARFLQSFLYGVSPLDPLSLAGVAMLLIVVATAACLVPARRAARTSPVEAFRAE